MITVPMTVLVIMAICPATACTGQGLDGVYSCVQPHRRLKVILAADTPTPVGCKGSVAIGKPGPMPTAIRCCPRVAGPNACDSRHNES